MKELSYVGISWLIDKNGEYIYVGESFLRGNYYNPSITYTCKLVSVDYPYCTFAQDEIEHYVPISKYTIIKKIK